MDSLTARMKKNWLTWAIVAAMVLGIICGSLFGEAMAQIKFVGDIFFRLIQMGIIAFIMCQITEAVGNLSGAELSKSGAHTIILFFISSLLASALGIAVCYVFQPGIGFDGSSLAGDAGVTVSQDISVQDMLTEFVPSNVFMSMGEGSIIQVIMFSIFLGGAISAWNAKTGKCRVLELVKELNELIMIIIQTVMKMAPLGIFAYVASTVGSNGAETLFVLIKYILVFGVADVILMAVWYLAVSIRCKMNIVTLFKKMLPMSLMAITTTSSAVTLPLEMYDAKTKLGLSDRIANLVLPLGMPLNSNGAAMWISFTAIMIAQIYGVHFDFNYLVYIAVMSVFLSLANAVVPGAGIVQLAMMVPQFGLPTESIAIFAGIDWLMGSFRTVGNVDSDVFCALLVARAEGEIDYGVFNDMKQIAE